MEVEALEGSEQPLVRGEAEGCSGDSGGEVADTFSARSETRLPGSVRSNKERNTGIIDDCSGEQSGRQEDLRWPPEPGVGRVVDGCADRVDRIRLLGNGVVPQTAAKAWQVLSSRLEGL